MTGVAAGWLHFAGKFHSLYMTSVDAASAGKYRSVDQHGRPLRVGGRFIFALPLRAKNLTENRN